MDQFYEQLLYRETIYLAFIVVIGTFFIRRIVETAVPSCRDKANGKLGSEYQTKFGLWWNSVVLYSIPVILGAFVAWVAFGTYTPENIKSSSSALVWGAVIGWCSSFIYKVVRKFLKKKTGVDLTPGPAEPDKDSEKPSAKDEEDEDSEKEAPESGKKAKEDEE